MVSTLHSTTRSPFENPWLEAVTVAALLFDTPLTVAIVPVIQLAAVIDFDVLSKAPRADVA